MRDVRIGAENDRRWMSAPPWSSTGERNRPYSREDAVFPAGASRTDKSFCPVGRADNVHGDRNLGCICPTPDDDRDEAA